MTGCALLLSLCLATRSSLAARTPRPQAPQAVFLEGGAGADARATKIQRELQEAERGVQQALGKHPRELQRVQHLLRTAAERAGRAHESEALARQERELAAQFVAQWGPPEADAAATQQVALGPDFQDALKATAQDFEQFLGSEDGGVASSADVEVAADTKSLETSQLLATQDHAEKAPAESPRDALSDLADGVSNVAAADRDILTETEDAKDFVKLELGDAGAAAVRALDKANAAAHEVVANEAREVQHVRQEIKRLGKSAPSTAEGPAQDEGPQPDAAESEVARHDEGEDRVPPAKQPFAAREARLARKDKALKARLAKVSREVVEGLQNGDSEDAEVAEVLQQHLTKARQLVGELAGFHQRLAGEATQREQSLGSLLRRLRKESSPRLLQRSTAASDSQASASFRAAAAQLRSGEQLLQETAAAKDAVLREVQGGGEAAKVRSSVSDALDSTELAEERVVAAAAQSLRRVRHH